MKRGEGWVTDSPVVHPEKRGRRPENRQGTRRSEEEKAWSKGRGRLPHRHLYWTTQEKKKWWGDGIRLGEEDTQHNGRTWSQLNFRAGRVGGSLVYLERRLRKGTG